MLILLILEKFLDKDFDIYALKKALKAYKLEEEKRHQLLLNKLEKLLKDIEMTKRLENEERAKISRVLREIDEL
ncbi:hypothetical protein [Arcobacter sp. CECT 8985]|uniref:hypothetical protein n=1 Tax=Arcobacter sp. CECT 8985 TaxID=1935424 RepID=UPI00100BBB2F|nr:hypothetical protein [Arcobacter sp. CECT 8985]RXJ87482.1 hypothetical protein CRU93_04005 [Arcobacter sp. CECT 8985]